MLSATKCFKKKVVTKNNDLGLFVNVVFDRESLEARMVVFPSLKGHKRRGEAISTIGSIGGRILSSASYEMAELSGAAGEVLTDTAYEASRKAEQREYDKVAEEASVYYLLPVSEITEVKKDEILLDKPTEEYDLYLGMKGTEIDVAFFNDEMYRDPERFIGISLNLVTVRGLTLKDTEGKKGRILDVVYDPEQGTATHLVVTTIGRGARRRFVDINSTDLSEMTVQKRFDDYPTSLPIF